MGSNISERQHTNVSSHMVEHMMTGCMYGHKRVPAVRRQTPGVGNTAHASLGSSKQCTVWVGTQTQRCCSDVPRVVRAALCPDRDTGSQAGPPKHVMQGLAHISLCVALKPAGSLITSASAHSPAAPLSERGCRPRLVSATCNSLWLAPPLVPRVRSRSA